MAKIPIITPRYIVIWDKDGVLADTHPYLVDILNRTFLHIDGHNRNPWPMNRTIHPTARHVLRERYGKNAIADQAYQYLLALYNSKYLEIPLIDGTMNSVKYFHNQAIIQGICTNDGQSHVTAYAREHGLTKFIDPRLMIGIEPGKTEGKPKTDTIEILLERIRERCGLSENVLKKLPIYMIDDSKPAVEMVETMQKKGYERFTSIVFDTHSLHTIAEHRIPMKKPPDTMDLFTRYRNALRLLNPDRKLDDDAKTITGLSLHYAETMKLCRLHRLYLSQGNAFMLVDNHATLQDFFATREHGPLSFLAQAVLQPPSPSCPSRH